MAKRKVIWTIGANRERKEILTYWIERTKSKRYSFKLNILINKAIELASEFPESGRKTNTNNTRVKIVKDYLIFYDFTQFEIIILSIWDANRNDKESAFNYT
jgi:plasmid stabilization system protein ParE